MFPDASSGAGRDEFPIYQKVAFPQLEPMTGNSFDHAPFSVERCMPASPPGRVQHPAWHRINLRDVSPAPFRWNPEDGRLFGLIEPDFHDL